MADIIVMTYRARRSYGAWVIPGEVAAAVDVVVEELDIDMGEARQRKTRIILASHMREKIIESLTDQVLMENPADVTTVN